MRPAMDDFDNVAEVRPANTLAERASKVRQMHKQHVRTTLEQARDIGSELIAAKAQCVRENKPWLPWLVEAKMNRRTASRYMRISEHWSLLVDYGTFASQGGVAEALNSLAGADREEEELHGGGRPHSDNPAAGLAPPPPVAAARCVDCLRKGRSGIDCERCKELNRQQLKGGRKQDAAPAAPPADREPGADDGELDAEQEKYDERRLDTVTSPMLRELRKIGATYGLEYPEAKKPWQVSEPRWWEKFDKRLQRPLKLLWDARKALRDVLKELEQGGSE